ncbi:MAG: SH3 domain-containing protein [Candidatus Omnitrophica bacterium]|nr:SH3 domain-containing protein [Candidatus Omnitrophota bacterium]
MSVRAGQNVNFERIDILPEGTRVIVRQEQYGWYKIQLPATSKVYVRMDYLTIENDTIGRVAANRVNVRAGRGANFSSVGQLEKGKYVRLVNKMDDWFQIVPVEGLLGWVSKDFVRYDSEVIPDLDSLGLAPIAEPSIVEADISSKVVIDENPSSAVSFTGIIEPIAPANTLNSLSYQLKTNEGKIYFLQGHPAVMGQFSRELVKVEGHLVSGMVKLPYPVVAVRKFQLVL